MLENIAQIVPGLFTINDLTILPSVLIFTIGILTAVYSRVLGYNKYREILILSASSSSILCILSQNFIVTFIAMELLSGFCFLLVIVSKKVRRKTALRYFLIHALAGVLMMIGILMNFNETQTFTISKLFFTSTVSPKYWIILVSLIINAAMFPFFTWFTGTYSKVDPFSLILLSTITTKTTFFVICKVLPGSGVLHIIGFITLIFSALLAFTTTDVLKFLLLTSIASLGFATMAVSYHGLLSVGNEIVREINFYIVWYMASSVLSISGFLTLYGFIINTERTGKTFSSIKRYFSEHASSIHFIIPTCIFGLCLAAFPFTVGFLTKSHILQFFVHEKMLYLSLKCGSVIFIMLAIRILMPIFHSIEFFKLDVKGQKLASILYSFAFLLVLLNIFAIYLFNKQYSIFTISVEFFTFMAYAIAAIVSLMILDFLVRVGRFERIISFFLAKTSAAQLMATGILRAFIKSIRPSGQFIISKLDTTKEILVFSKITLSLAVGVIASFAIVLILLVPNF